MSEVLELERQIGFILPKDYKDFVAQYGGGIVGPYRIYGRRAAPAMGSNESSALMVTERFRKQRWAGTEGWLVVSTDHAGNPIGLDKEGKVWIADHDAGIVEVIACGFEEYLRKRCLNLPE
jgi:hypothetical protein